MSGFTLDTSGSVDHVMTEGCVETGLEFEWEDLDAFTQGYIEALFAEWHRRACALPFVKGREWPHFEAAPREDFPASFTDATGKRWDIVRHHGSWKRTDCQTPGEFPAFSDLAPETLARIISDCLALLDAKRATGGNVHEGRNFWTLRQGGYYASEGFPPHAVTLGDDGKVIFSETPR